MVDEVGAISTILSRLMSHFCRKLKKEGLSPNSPALQHQTDFFLTATLQNCNTAAPSFDCNTAEP